MATDPTPLAPGTTDLIAALGHLSIAVDCPPVTALIALIKDVRDTMDPALLKELDTIQVDWNMRLYWGIIVPELRRLGLPDPPTKA